MEVVTKHPLQDGKPIPKISDETNEKKLPCENFHLLLGQPVYGPFSVVTSFMESFDLMWKFIRVCKAFREAGMAHIKNRLAYLETLSMEHMLRNRGDAILWLIQNFYPNFGSDFYFKEIDEFMAWLLKNLGLQKEADYVVCLFFLFFAKRCFPKASYYPVVNYIIDENQNYAEFSKLFNWLPNIYEHIKLPFTGDRGVKDDLVEYGKQETIVYEGINPSRFFQKMIRNRIKFTPEHVLTFELFIRRFGIKYDRTFWNSDVVFEKQYTHSTYNCNGLQLYNDFYDIFSSSTNYLELASAVLGVHIVNFMIKDPRFPRPTINRSYCLALACRNNQVDVVKLLLENGADPRANKSCSLRVAAKYGRLEVVKILLEWKSPKVRINDDYDYALRFAVAENHEEVVELLLKNGAYAWVQGNSPIRMASAVGNAKVVKMLLDCKESGFNPSDKSNQALLNACFRGHFEVVKLLLSDKRLKIDGDGVEFFENAIISGNDDIFKFLLDYKQLKPSYKCFEIAIKRNNDGIVGFLLDTDKLELREKTKVLKTIAQNGACSCLVTVVKDERIKSILPDIVDDLICYCGLALDNHYKITALEFNRILKDLTKEVYPINISSVNLWSLCRSCVVHDLPQMLSVVLQLTDPKIVSDRVWEFLFSEGFSRSVGFKKLILRNPLFWKSHDFKHVIENCGERIIYFVLKEDILTRNGQSGDDYRKIVEYLVETESFEKLSVVLGFVKNETLIEIKKEFMPDQSEKIVEMSIKYSKFWEDESDTLFSEYIFEEEIEMNSEKK